MSLYSPLPSSEPSFRLLRLLPSRISSSRIYCELEVANIEDSAGKYVAGSYVWGPETPAANIRVNGVKTEVRENLVHFLRACRLKREVFVIWIDAVCINQNNLEERSNQVAIMDRIFNSAESVYSCLGPCSDTAAALKACETANTHKLSQTDLQDLEPDMQEVVNCDYWTRVWVVQEFVLAREIFLLAGPHKIPLEIVTQLISVMAFHHSNASKVFRLRYIRTLGFEEIFWTLCAMECALPLDRLFALMGMLAPVEAGVLRPLIDYDRSTAEILGSVMVTGLVKQYSRFLRLFETFVARNEQLQDTAHQIDLPFVPCAHIAQHQTQNCSNSDLGHIHTHAHLPCHSKAYPWPTGVQVPYWWSQQLARSFDVLEIHRNTDDSHIGTLCMCVLVPECDQSCNSGCLGHELAGIALMNNVNGGLKLSWAYILGNDSPDYKRWLDTPLKQDDRLLWQACIAEMATTLKNCVDWKMKVARVNASSFEMRTHLRPFKRLCKTCSNAEEVGVPEEPGYRRL